MADDKIEYGLNLAPHSYVCPRCAALVYLSDEAKAGHDAFHEQLDELVMAHRAQERYEEEMRERNG